MHIFVIPSWYPHRCFPLEGEYVREQVIAFAECEPGTRMSLGLWGQGQGHLTAAHLLHSPRCALEFLARRAGRREIAAGVTEYLEPTWTWSDWIAHGHRTALLAASRRNLQCAIATSGPVDVVHAHVSYPAGWIAMRLASETGVPYVITEHMGPFPLPTYARSDGRLRPEIERSLAEASARIAVSPTLADRIVAFGLPRPEVVPNVVDERLYTIRSEHAPGPFRWFTLCGMEVAKGIHDLLEAIARMRDRLGPAASPSVRFVLGGEGPALGAFRAHARDLGIDPWVEWLGLLSREAARREFSACDAFVLPSHHESFGIVFVEAIASGVPVVATRCGGPESIVRPENGLLVDVARPDELATAMIRIMERRQDYDPVRIRAGFLERYSRRSVSDALAAIYRRAIVAHAGAASVQRGPG